MKKVIIIFVSLFLYSVSYSQPKAVFQKEGEKVQFDGTLLSKEAVAKILAEREFSQKKCDIEKDAINKKCDLDCNYKLEKQKTSSDYEKQKLEMMLKLKDEELQKITEIALKPDYTKWWFIGGILIGAASSLGIFLTIEKIR